MTFANSFNVARRLSEKNEPDFVQDMFAEDSSISYEQCQRIVSQIGSMYNMPMECQKFGDLGYVRNNMTMKAFDGMGSSGAAAASARAAGRENYAQIQRRYTNPKRFSQEDH